MKLDTQAEHESGLLPFSILDHKSRISFARCQGDTMTLWPAISGPYVCMYVACSIVRVVWSTLYSAAFACVLESIPDEYVPYLFFA
jgi:hypothetical protein